MSFDWADYLELAKILKREGSSSSFPEARFRSSISRAYYAVYCLSRDYLISKGDDSIPDNGEAHEIVRRAFQNHSDPRRKEIGIKLTRLRARRGQADYDADADGLEKLAELSIIAANAAIADLRKLK